MARKEGKQGELLCLDCFNHEMGPSVGVDILPSQFPFIELTAADRKSYNERGTDVWNLERTYSQIRGEKATQPIRLHHQIRGDGERRSVRLHDLGWREFG